MSVFRAGLFSGKVAIVTGGGTGIGKAISGELASLGATVVIASRKLDRLKAAADNFNNKKSGNCAGSITPIQCNIRNQDEVKTTVEKVLADHKKIDLLVNNGGGQFLSPLQDISLKGWNAVIETNLTGAFLMSQEVYKQHMRDCTDTGSCIVNIVCDMFRGFPLMAHTGAARAAVENLTKTMAIEFAENGVRVNCVAPGVIYSDTARSNYGPVDVFEMAKPEIPSQRLGTPDEVASAVTFLLSPGAAFINGATLRVDSGSSLYAKLFTRIPPHDRTPEYKWQEEE